MFFWLKLFCFTLLWNNIAVTKFTEYEFHCIPLGHSGLVITWNPNAQTNLYFKLGSRIKEDQTNINTSVIDIPPPDQNSISFYSLDYKNNVLGQFKIHSLQEDTTYEIFIRHHPAGDFQVFDCKTNSITNTKPAKPDFQCEESFEGNVYHPIRQEITWFPCGKERNCVGKEAGTHFAIKLRALDRRGECRIEEYFNDHRIIFIVPGVVYEVTVISINNNSTTESDSQEIFRMPTFGAVRSIKVVSFPNVSILMSWEAPKFSRDDLHGYQIAVINEELVTNSSIIMLSRFQEPEHNFTHEFQYSPGKKFFEKDKYQLKPKLTYIFSIIPQGKGVAGIETQVKYTIPDY